MLRQLASLLLRTYFVSTEQPLFPFPLSSKFDPSVQVGAYGFTFSTNNTTLPRGSSRVHIVIWVLHVGDPSAQKLSSHQHGIWSAPAAIAMGGKSVNPLMNKALRRCPSWQSSMLVSGPADACALAPRGED